MLPKTHLPDVRQHSNHFYADLGRSSDANENGQQQDNVKEEEEEEHYRPRFQGSSNRRDDKAARAAVEVLKGHYTNARGKPIKTPFFARQLQVLYETDYFPWVINDALAILVKEGHLICIDSQEIPGFDRLGNVKNMKFYANAKAEPTRAELHRTMKKKAYNIAKVVNGYSHPTITENFGIYLQELVWYELRAQRFRVVGSNTNEYRGREWTSSNFNLDHIAEHESGRLTVGVEVKNTLSIMRKEEIDEKIAICKHLGITPVFAVRWIKPYINYIKRKGGFCWVFKTQIYPRPYQWMVNEIYTRLSVPDRHDSRGHRLDFPVSVASRLPELSVKNFERWVNSKVKYTNI